MSCYTLTHLSNPEWVRDLASIAAKDRSTTAQFLAHIAEADARRLYVPAGYPSMFTYCVQELHLCEQTALKRIHAARAARRFPAIFEAVADGRLHLSAVVLLASHLTQQTADELLQAAAHRTKSEIERMLAERFPQPDVATLVGPLPVTPAPLTTQLSPGKVEQQSPNIASEAFVPVEPLTPRPRIVPLAPQRFALQVTIGQHTLDKLHRAQELLSHQVPSGDVAEVLDRSLDALILKLEKTKCAATDRPRTPRRRSKTSGRYIPALVRRAVWKRDGGRCTFVSDKGQRCPSRKRLEYDHIDEVARGVPATVSNIRLRCRPTINTPQSRRLGPSS